MQKTTFNVSKMDCASEEQLIRMKLDVPNRKLEVFHAGDFEPISQALDSLRLNAKFVETGTADDFSPEENAGGERKLLRQVPAINFSFFAVETVAGFISVSISEKAA